MTVEHRPIVLSLHPKWEVLVRSGRKTVELRRRFPTSLAGSLAYVYCTSPDSVIFATVHLNNISRLQIDELWRLKGEASCVDKGHFTKYFKDCEFGMAIELAQYTSLDKRWTLQRLREKLKFTAPQSWCYASEQLIDKIRGEQ